MPELLRSVDSTRAMKYLARVRQRRDGELVPRMRDVAAAAGGEPREGKTVTVYMPRCHVIHNRETDLWILGGQNAQVYVVSLALDLSGGGAVQNGLEVGEVPEPIQQLAERARNYVCVAATPLFADIRDDTDLPLYGNGVTLYGPKDPAGLLEFHTYIMEDDGGYRRLGQIIEQRAEQTGLAEKVAALAELSAEAASLGAPEVFALQLAARLFFTSVVIALQENRDDVIQDFHFSALSVQGYLGGVYTVDGPGAQIQYVVDVR